MFARAQNLKCGLVFQVSIRSLHIVFCTLDFFGFTDSSIFPISLFSDNCPDGWVFKHGTGSCYFLSSNILSWPNANSACQALAPGAGLVSIHTAEEQNFLEGNLKGHSAHNSKSGAEVLSNYVLLLFC